jgi:hypothetical protein
MSRVFNHRSNPFHLAAKDRHKKKLKKQRAYWFATLNDSDSEDELDEELDDITSNLRLLNLSHNTQKCYGSRKLTVNLTESSNIHSADDSIHWINKDDKNRLKTNILRNQIANMMQKSPDKSSIWNADLF